MSATSIPNEPTQAKAQLERGGKQRPQAITDFRRILDDKEVDALFCEAPNHWHGPATILACAAGKHVYVEKPCSHNPREGEQMVAAARKHNRAVQMGSQRRSTPGVIEAMTKLHEGVIGNVYCAAELVQQQPAIAGDRQADRPPPTLDYELWQGPAPRTPYLDNRIHYNWHWFWHWGNGELGNNGVHALDLCRWGLDVEFPAVVISSGGRYRFHDDQQTPDTHVANYEFPGGKQITWQGLSCNKHPDSTGFVSFYGDKGALSLGQFGDYKIYNADDRLIEKRPDDADGRKSLAGDRHVPHRQFHRGDPQWRPLRPERPDRERAPEHAALPSRQHRLPDATNAQMQPGKWPRPRRRGGDGLLAARIRAGLEAGRLTAR